MTYAPANGYGNPIGDSYIHHSDYATYTSNVAFANLSEPFINAWNAQSVYYDVFVPEGGFAICAHDSGTAEGASALVQAILGVNASTDINVNTNNVDNIRLSYDVENQRIVLSVVA